MFDRHARTIYNFCFRRTGDWALAEDLMSVVFLEAWRRRDQVELEPDTALPWLYGVATNVLRNERRARRRHTAALSRLPSVALAPDEATDAVERLEDRRRIRAALGVLAQLPRQQREVIALCAFTDLSYSQIAEALAIPVGTVRSRVSRAREQAAALLESERSVTLTSTGLAEQE